MLPLRTRGQAGGLQLPAPPHACGAPLLASLRHLSPSVPGAAVSPQACGAGNTKAEV